jgi:DNA-directed RNA polymerase subunit K/omega
VDVKFPDNTESRWKLGLYAASRASQIRRMRAPKPQVERGAKVD